MTIFFRAPNYQTASLGDIWRVALFSFCAMDCCSSASRSWDDEQLDCGDNRPAGLIVCLGLISRRPIMASERLLPKRVLPASGYRLGGCCGSLPRVNSARTAAREATINAGGKLDFGLDGGFMYQGWGGKGHFLVVPTVCSTVLHEKSQDPSWLWQAACNKKAILTIAMTIMKTVIEKTPASPNFWRFRIWTFHSTWNGTIMTVRGLSSKFPKGFCDSVGHD